MLRHFSFNGISSDKKNSVQHPYTSFSKNEPTSKYLTGCWNLIVIKVVLEPTMILENKTLDLRKQQAEFKPVCAPQKDPPCMGK